MLVVAKDEHVTAKRDATSTTPVLESDSFAGSSSEKCTDCKNDSSPCLNVLALHAASEPTNELCEEHPASQRLEDTVMSLQRKCDELEKDLRETTTD